MTEWYRTAFDADYLRRYDHRDDAEAEADIAALVAWVQPPRDRGLLDLACGGGRHLLALHRGGFVDLTGVDLSSDLLREARRRLDDAGCEDVALLRSDMRDLPYVDRFATVLSLFTSFGYFDDERENERVLCAAWRALESDGLFVVDTLSRQHTIDTLVTSEERRLADRVERIERRISEDGRRVEKTVNISTGRGVERTVTESVRMYEAEDLAERFEAAGFSGIEVAGALDGRPFRCDSRRLVVAGRKEAQ